ncbi:hypothetical protein IEO21_08210 [Rhodonia placenta]|uniref:F-box domain-containing protein n=1 Tax=Rhodonia placenta TaxID=104341 RepID=A0A8H7NWK4_9APHY|nr:hypothetical protein IEO21_08210 [Postia placenta]
MSNIGTIEDASDVLPVPSSPTTDTASLLATSTVVDTSSPIFPIEVFEHIIDNCCIDEACHWCRRCYIQEDQKTLLACALTCKAWLPRSRFQLLRRVTLFKSQMVKLTRLLNAHPDMANWVQHLAVYIPGDADHTRHTWNADALIMLARRMPMLKCLVFEGAYIYTPRFNRRSTMCLLEFPAITSLSLSHVFLPSVTDLGRLILSIPALRTLECARVGFKKDGLDFRGLPPRVTRLRLSSVGLDDCPEKDIVELLLATSTGEHIEALDVRMSIAAYGVRRLLQHSGKALRTLRMFGFREFLSLWSS